MLYESKFIRYNEAFASNKILRAIQLTNKVVSKRAGGQIHTSSYIEEFANAEGKFGGIIGLMTGGRMIRYNYRLNDASAEIVSVDFWLTPKKGIKPPDYTFETEGINIVNLIDVIVSILKKDITDDKLKNTRVSLLWRDFDYWYKEIYTGNLSQMSEPGFKNYIVDFMKSRGIQNIYMRSIKVKSGNKEKIINTDKNLAHLYGLFHDNNNAKTVILFDDCQEVMAKKYIGLVSAALDDHDPRIINFPLDVGKVARKFNPNLKYYVLDILLKATLIILVILLNLYLMKL